MSRYNIYTLIKYSIFLTLTYIILVCIGALPFPLPIKAYMFAGYSVNCNYKKHPKERDIAYQYYLDEESQYLPGITKEEIGIDLYDIDDDGKEEILVYINGGDKCPAEGCPFTILKEIEDKARPYRVILWLSSNNPSIKIHSNDELKILDTITSGHTSGASKVARKEERSASLKDDSNLEVREVYHDILLNEYKPSVTLYRWNGTYYNMFRN